MNILKTFFATVCAAVLLVSCNGTSSLLGTQMDTEEGVQKVVDILSKNIDTKEWKIVEVRWSDDELSNNVEFVVVDMVNKDGRPYTQAFVGAIGFAPGDLSEARTTFYKADPKDILAIDLSKIDAKRIVANIEAAKKMIPQEYQFKSLADYRLSNTEKDPDKEETFTINVTEKGKETVRSAGKESLVYYEIEFQVNKDGKVFSPTLKNLENEE